MSNSKVTWKVVISDNYQPQIHWTLQPKGKNYVIPNLSPRFIQPLCMHMKYLEAESLFREDFSLFLYFIC